MGLWIFEMSLEFPLGLQWEKRGDLRLRVNQGLEVQLDKLIDTRKDEFSHVRMSLVT